MFIGILLAASAFVRSLNFAKKLHPYTVKIWVDSHEVMYCDEILSKKQLDNSVVQTLYTVPTPLGPTTYRLRSHNTDLRSRNIPSH